MADNTHGQQAEDPFSDAAATASLAGTADEAGSISMDKPASPGFRKYTMMYSTSRTNVAFKLGSRSGPTMYFGSTHLAMTGSSKPQVRLRRGDSKKSPVISFARIPAFTKTYLIGKGDCEAIGVDPDTLVCEDFTRQKNYLQRSDYHFATSEGSDRRVEYTWRKDREKWLRTGYDCVDDEGRVVARMLSGGGFNFNKGGLVEVQEDVAPELESFLLITSLVIWVMEAAYYRSIFQAFDDDDDDKGEGQSSSKSKS